MSTHKDRHDDELIQAAWRYGQEARKRHAQSDWDDALESELERGWKQTADAEKLDWKQARTVRYQRRRRGQAMRWSAPCWPQLTDREDKCA